MAGLRFIAQSTEQALDAATAKSLIRVKTQANVRAKIIGWGVYFDGVSATEAPVEVRLATGDSANGGTFSNNLGAPDANGSESCMDGSNSLSSSTSSTGAASEPTILNVIDMVEVHPQSGFTQMYESGTEPILNGDSFVVIECTAPAAVNARTKIIYEE